MIHAYRPDGSTWCDPFLQRRGPTVTSVRYRELCVSCRRQVAMLCRRLAPPKEKA